MRSQHTLPVRGARFRCGHPTTLDNVTYRRHHPTERYRPACRTCDRAKAVRSHQTRQAKRHPVRKLAIVRPDVAALIESCRAQYEAAIAAKTKPGRPRKSQQTTTHSEAA